MTRYAIKYRSESTANGRPIGWVYVEDIGHLSPGCWSYVKDPKAATLYPDYEAAERVRQQKRWNESSVVPVEIEEP